MKKYLPILLVTILSGMTINNVYADEQADVDDVTMDVIEHSDPHAVTNDLQLPDQSSQEAKDHVASAGSEDEHASSESHDNATEDAHEDSQAAAHEDAMEDSKAAAQEQAHDAMQDASDASASKGD